LIYDYTTTLPANNVSPYKIYRREDVVASSGNSYGTHIDIAQNQPPVIGYTISGLMSSNITMVNGSLGLGSIIHVNCSYSSKVYELFLLLISYNGTSYTGEVITSQYDPDPTLAKVLAAGNAMGVGQKILSTNVAHQTNELLGLGEYGTYEQNEVGNEETPLCLNHRTFSSDGTVVGKNIIVNYKDDTGISIQDKVAYISDIKGSTNPYLIRKDAVYIRGNVASTVNVFYDTISSTKYAFTNFGYLANVDTTVYLAPSSLDYTNVSNLVITTQTDMTVGTDMSKAIKMIRYSDINFSGKADMYEYNTSNTYGYLSDQVVGSTPAQQTILIEASDDFQEFYTTNKTNIFAELAALAEQYEQINAMTFNTSTGDILHVRVSYDNYLRFDFQLNDNYNGFAGIAIDPNGNFYIQTNHVNLPGAGICTANMFLNQLPLTKQVMDRIFYFAQIGDIQVNLPQVLESTEGVNAGQDYALGFNKDANGYIN
jgi:hypothetical protein